MQLTKENLYNELQKYIYDSKFGDLGVLSKQYFHCIVSPCYNDNEHNSLYSVISIDFNNMNEINKNGMERGDEILYDSISIMQSVLPKDSYTVRLGGDEFLFILPNSSTEEAKEVENQMHQKMAECSKQIDGTTMTSYCVPSNLSNNIDSLIEIADTAITAIKQNAKMSQSLDNWDILNQKAKENFSTFFKTLRFHNFPLGPEHVQKILMYATNTYDTLLKDDSQKQEQDDMLEENSKDNTLYSTDELKKLNRLLASNSGEIDYDLLDEFNEETLANILNSMVRDPITLQFTEPYLKNFLLEECSDNFKALKISPVFVKLSNTLNSSHHQTNKQIQKNEQDLYKFLSNKINFNQDTYTDKPLNYMIALSGGDMLLTLDSKTELNVEDIKSYLENSYSDGYSNNDLLRYVVADDFTDLNKDNYNEVFFKQTDECNKNKIPLIETLLKDDIVQDLLDVSLKDTINFYKELVPDVDNISAKAKYMNILSNTVLDVYSTLDVAHDKSFVERGSNPVKHDRNFVPKVKIDYSKINYSKYNQNNQKEKTNEQDFEK